MKLKGKGTTEDTENTEKTITTENAENTGKPLRGNSSRGDALDRQGVLNP